jgi:hypothetical protein
MAALKSVPIGLVEQSRGVDIPTLFLIVEREREKTMQILLNLSSPPTSDKEEVETRELEETRGFDGHDPVFYIGVSIPIVLFIIVDSVLLYVFHVF